MKSKLKLMFVMILWGSIAVFARNIALSSTLLAFSRAVIGLPVVYIFIKKNKQSVLPYLKLKAARPVMISGMLIGLAWAALFMAFRYTSIANATLVYNMCPIYVFILAPILLKEKLKSKQIFSVIVAFAGLFLIVATSLNLQDLRLTGIFFGLISGMAYAVIVIINRKFSSDLPCEVATFIQLLMAAVVLLPFILFENPIGQWLNLSAYGLVMLLILGIIHTGIAYHIYFSSYKELSAVVVALFSYLDPVFSIIFGVLLLGEPLGIYQVVGGIMILGSTLGANLPERRRTLGSKGVIRS